jgi:hypothetical protein
MARQRWSSGGGIALPWERRGAWGRRLVEGRRWKALLGVVVLLGALVAVGRSADHRERVVETRATIAEIKRGISSFRADVGRCPQSIYELMHPPRSGRRYLRRVPVDGWGRAFWVRCPGRYDPDGVDVVSAGPSGSWLVDDNVQ